MDHMTPKASAWFSRRTSRSSDWPLPALMAAKAAGNHRISVVIPAHNEERTIADVVLTLRRELMERVPLIDELVVIDSDSTDETSTIAASAGAEVYAASGILSDVAPLRGKGEALWKSLFVTSGDIIVFMDADLTLWGPHFVTGLLGPLLDGTDIRLVKGFYDRVSASFGQPAGTDGGRVTELVARPLLNLWWPDLAGLVQPLAGEWAVRRSLMESIRVPVGYGVELATVLDAYAISGLDAIAQVDLGSRAHEHQSNHDLALMAAELLAVGDRRRPDRAWTDPTGQLLQYTRSADGQDVLPAARPIPLAERPAAASMPAYGKSAALS
ncbi:glucosyl-3-phosphoglycerate synthase [Arthrobacter sp. MMS18-M83]|uniref:glucosyl-3-phosphoglycerate synthase n=1 Tax=Arthrobacter sp. MMS18-M83 TaxID=2996261 RepID=UPI00227A459E|nr:glucosyl-3-phosphoglycerate synthase [Arthrobacter sp. MMS18-M83]WAH97685.1 glucosyl-3-phosphoglycerate synthase [Arthrobacter sp. MMS18-M83]